MKNSLFRFTLLMLVGFFVLMPVLEPQAKEKKWKTYHWQMTSWASKGNLSSDIFADFCKQVEEMSGGRLMIKYTGSGEVIGEGETFNAVRSGLIEVAVPYPGYYSGAVHSSLIETGLPFSLTNAREIETLFWKRGFAKILREEVYGPLGCYYVGPSIQSGTPLISKTPIKSISDIKGMKIRAGGPQAKVLDKLGAKVCIVPYGEVYTALATGVVDGAVCGSTGETFDLKLFEMAKNYMYPNVVPAQICPLLVNMKAWKSLTPDLQKIVEIAARQHSQYMEIEMWHQDAHAWQEMRKAGVVQHTLNAEDQAELRKIGEAIWDELSANDSVSKKLVGVLKDYMEFLGYLD